MKLKEYFYMLGIKPREKRYGYQIKQFNLDSLGVVEYAQWKHPRETEKYIKEEDITNLKTFLKDGDFCIDIGAHTGDSTIPMALAVGKNGFILAMEPNPFVFTVLNKNTCLNKNKTNILPLMIAASQEDGDLEFKYSDSGFCNGGLHENVSRWKHGDAFKITVNGMNLSDLLHDRFSEKLPALRYIKTDTEGNDLGVLESISNIIEEYRPFIKAEVFKLTGETYREQMYSFFSDRKYKIFKINDESDYRGEELKKTDMMKWEHFDIFCVPIS